MENVNVISMLSFKKGEALETEKPLVTFAMERQLFRVGSETLDIRVAAVAEV